MTAAQRCRICGERLGERRCVALDDTICSTCCGAHRRRSIACPPSCQYLIAAERRRRERRARELAQAWQDFEAILLARKLDALIPYMEAVKYLLAQLLHRAPAEDTEVETALTYLAQRLSPIELVEPYVPKLGELLERALLPLVQRGRMDPEGLREALRALAGFVDGFRKEDEPDRFVTALLGTYPPEEEKPTGLIVRP